MIGNNKKLAVALMCADWRLHHKRVGLAAMVARHLKVHGVDVIAAPGPDGLLKADRKSEWATALSQIKLLIGAHAPSALAVVAHQRCAGHPVGDSDHEADVAATAKALKSETGFAGPVAALVATYASDTKWGLKSVGSF